VKVSDGSVQNREGKDSKSSEDGEREEEEVILEVELPSGVYVDTYEIDSLFRKGNQRFSLCVSPPSINLEAHASNSPPLLLLLLLSPFSSAQSCFPIHMRYHSPSHEDDSFHIAISLRPHVLVAGESSKEKVERMERGGDGEKERSKMRCLHSGEREREEEEWSVSVSNTSDWRFGSHRHRLLSPSSPPAHFTLSLPRGKERDLVCVRWGTLLTTLAGVACITLALVRSR
jgi:hypothetical protein